MYIISLLVPFVAPTLELEILSLHFPPEPRVIDVSNLPRSSSSRKATKEVLVHQSYIRNNISVFGSILACYRVKYQYMHLSFYFKKFVMHVFVQIAFVLQKRDIEELSHLRTMIE